jgi:hypothetical protein
MEDGGCLFSGKKRNKQPTDLRAIPREGFFIIKYAQCGKNKPEIVFMQIKQPANGFPFAGGRCPPAGMISRKCIGTMSPSWDELFHESQVRVFNWKSAEIKSKTKTQTGQQVEYESPGQPIPGGCQPSLYVLAHANIKEISEKARIALFEASYAGRTTHPPCPLPEQNREGGEVPEF